LAQAHLELADPAGARAVLRQIRDILQLRPDLGIVATQADELRHMLDTIRAGPVGASSLTAAELRLLPLLATHLSYPDIGDRLHVSRNTVKSHAVSIYRKLGASSRSEAINIAEEIGLLRR
jgi:LuxR family maltose regulon positive regulatory protein